jgi:uncharacterized repeat protein (TIGR01451 family)
MSRLSATFVLNYLTRVVPSLGHVGTKMRPDRVVKGAAILVAIGGVFSGTPAFAATFTWATRIAPTGPGGPTTGTTYTITNTGVKLRINFDVTGGTTLNTLAPSKLGGPNAGADPNITLGANITTAGTVIGGAGPFGNLGIRSVFVNAAGQAVPVDGLNYQLVDIDKDDDSNFPPFNSPPSWQDQMTTFALNGTTPLPITGTLVGGTVGTVQANSATPFAVTTGNPAATLGTLAATPTQALSFLGIVDLDITSTNGTGPEDDASGTLPANYLQEASNRSQEGNVRISMNGGASATEFVVLYGDGNNFVGTSTGHGAGVLGQIDFTPGVIGVRKQATAIVPDPAVPGGFIVTYQVGVTNLGETRLTNVVLDDNLTAAVSTYDQSFGNFGADATGVTIVANSLQPVAGNPGTPLVLNTATYTGSGATDQLLGANNVLELSETKTLTYQVKFTPNAGITQFNSQVVAEGTMPGGGITRDRSNDGAGIEDAPGDLDPTSDNDNVVGNTLLIGTDAILPATASAGSFDAAGLRLASSVGAGDDTVTSFRITPPSPQIGVTKQVLGVPVPVAGQPGAYDITYRQIVSNVSSALVAAPSLNTVTLTEDFSNNNNPDLANRNAFRIGQANGAASATVLAGSVTSPATAPAGYPADYLSSTANVNPAFSGGVGNTNLFNTPITLANRGSYSIIDYVVRVVPQPGIPLEGLPPFEGQVSTSGNFPTGQEGVTGETRDLSDDVTGVAAASQVSPADGSANQPLTGAGLPLSNPIPALDGDAARNENNRTPVTLSSDPAIGLLKRVVGTPTNNGDGTYNVTFRYTVTNTGPVGLTGVSISDNIQAQFADNGLKPVVSNPKRPIDEFLGIVSTDTTQPVGNAPAVAGLSANRALSDTPADALSTVATLAPGQSSVVDVVVKIRPGAANLSYSYDGAARAAGVGTNAARTPVADISDDGTIIGGIAQTPTPNTLRPAVGNPNDPNAQNPTPVVLDPIKVTLYKAITTVPGQTFTTPLSAEGLVLNAPDDVKGVSKLNRNLTNGDQVIYTLYAVNSSGAPIVDFEVCDALQAGQLLVIPNTLPLPSGVTSVGFGPLTPPTGGTTLLPLGRTCDPRTGGVGGTIVFTIPSLPTGTTALPFTIRVNR